MANDFNLFMQNALDFNNMIYNELKEVEIQDIYEDAFREFSLQVEA